MHVQMHHGLSGGNAIVDADVVAGRLELAIEVHPHQVEQLEQGGLLALRALEQRCDVPLGDDQRVARRDGKCVADRERGVAVEEDAVARYVTEETRQVTRPS